MILGNAALRKLVWMKLRGGLRRQGRRMRTPSGLLFMVFGVGLMGLWLTTIILSPRLGEADRGGWSGDLLRSAAQFGLAFLAAISAAGALSVRGLYLPKQEIERMFSIPVSRSDLVRYRMQIDLGRTLLGALVLGILVNRRMPVPLFGFLGAFLSIMTLAVVRQAASLVVGDAQGRIGRFLRRRKLTGLRVLMALAAWVAIMALVFGEDFFEGFSGLPRDADPSDLFRRVLLHPATQVLLAPFRPWAEMMTAESAAQFLKWGVLCVALFLGLYELTARLPIDFREMSLETSAEVAKRLSSLRRGGPFASSDVSRGAAARRVPWLFGRGPFGAVAWIKTAAIVRKAGGTLLVSVFVVGLVTFLVSILVRGISIPSEIGEPRSRGPESVAPALIALLGTVYLAGGMRFDFRSELDRMESIKSWPLAPARLFLAAILPQALLIWLLLSIAILLRAIVLGAFHPAIGITLVGLPFVTVAWLAIDNAVFLLAPVRFVPGQEGALHHTGRAMVLLLLRVTVFTATALAVTLVAWLAALGGRSLLGLSDAALAALVIGCALVVLVLMDALLIHVGGRLLRRFDVARDRG